jgi:hypothetical protein
MSGTPFNRTTENWSITAQTLSTATTGTDLTVFANNNIIVRTDNVIVGRDAGFVNQGTNAIAIGLNTGQSNQGTNAIAIGSFASQGNQGTFSIAIGYQSGQDIQAQQAIAIGYQAGQGVASSAWPMLGSTYVDNAVTLSTKTGINTNNQLDIYSDTYFNNSYNNMAAIVKSTQIP